MPVKTILITGCSSGIGHSLALAFHHAGLRVFATARNPSSVTSLSSLGITVLPLEVTSAKSIESLFTTISDLTGGKLDILINNAGRNYTVPALDAEAEEIRDVFETNVFAVMAICQTFAPLVIAAKGTIVQIGSLAGIMPYPFGAVYNASKAALHSYSETLRLELEPFNVKVMIVVTGGVKSNIARVKRTLLEGSLYLPLEEVYEARLTHSQAVGMGSEEYAKAVMKQVLSNRPKQRVWEGGKVWLVWFAHVFLPRWVLATVLSRMFKLHTLRGNVMKKNQ